MSKYIPKTGPIARAVMKSINEQPAGNPPEIEWRHNYARVSGRGFTGAQACALVDMTTDFCDYVRSGELMGLTPEQRNRAVLVAAESRFCDARSR